MHTHIYICTCQRDEARESNYAWIQLLFTEKKLSCPQTHNTLCTVHTAYRGTLITLMYMYLNVPANCHLCSHAVLNTSTAAIAMLYSSKVMLHMYLQYTEHMEMRDIPLKWRWGRCMYICLQLFSYKLMRLQLDHNLLSTRKETTTAA